MKIPVRTPAIPSCFYYKIDNQWFSELLFGSQYIVCESLLFSWMKNHFILLPPWHKDTKIQTTQGNNGFGLRWGLYLAENNTWVTVVLGLSALWWKSLVIAFKWFKIAIKLWTLNFLINWGTISLHPISLYFDCLSFFFFIENLFKQYIQDYTIE